MSNKFSIANSAGGDLKRFRLLPDGTISDAAIRHARKLGQWVKFEGPSAEAAQKFFEQNEEDRANA